MCKEKKLLVLIALFLLIPTLATKIKNRPVSLFDDRYVSKWETWDSNLTVNGDVDVNGNVNADYFIGDGSQLTGLGTALNDTFVSKWEVWNSDLNVTGLIRQSGLLLSELFCLLTGCNMTGNLTVNGSVTADYFIGNGSQLTDVQVDPITQLPAENITAGEFGADVGGGDYSFPNKVSALNLSSYEFNTDNILMYENFLLTYEKNLTVIPMSGQGRMSLLGDLYILNSAWVATNDLRSSSGNIINIRDDVDVSGYGIFDGDLNTTGDLNVDGSANVEQNLTVSGDMILDSDGEGTDLIMTSNNWPEGVYNGSRLVWLYNDTGNVLASIYHDYYMALGLAGLNLESDNNINIKAGWNLNMSAGNDVIFPETIFRNDDEYITWGWGNFGSRDLYTYLNGTEKTMHFRPYIWMSGGEFLWNRDNYDVDWHYKGVTDNNLFYIDAGQDKVCIGSNCSDINATFGVDGNVTILGTSLKLNGIETCLADGTNCISGEEIRWNISESRYLYNDTGTLDVNETALNLTIDERVSKGITSLPAENITAGTFGASFGNGSFVFPENVTVVDAYLFDQSEYIQQPTDGVIEIMATNSINFTTEVSSFKDTRPRVRNNVYSKWEDVDGNMLMQFVYSDSNLRDPEIRFGDSENTVIGFPEPNYFAFINDNTEFWLGNSGDPTLYFNYYVGSGEYHGTSTNPQTVDYYVDQFRLNDAGGGTNLFQIDKDLNQRMMCVVGPVGGCANIHWRSGSNTMGTIEFVKDVGDSQGLYISTSADDIKLVPSTSSEVEIQGNLNVTYYNITGNYISSDGSQGVTNTTGFWMCVDSGCASTCQVQIKNGLVVGCV